ncbi:hypothetical protein BT96DRAFT_298823 [Gymnopus androsaceus JB14]|uniref:Uncharacterized protein n=1 Tax=Gymnopus androsaceus JB14 TaxID=1447944 RepID=A0A6A4H0G6_9AGAR|nr:hypothetical protein BT96DRAFT_298823 [Gymnopus androsaceus JB14]
MVLVVTTEVGEIGLFLLVTSMARLFPLRRSRLCLHRIGLPPKPVLRAPSPGFDRQPRGAPSHRDRGPSPSRDWPRNGRSDSPVDIRGGQRRPPDRNDNGKPNPRRPSDASEMDVDPPHHRRDHKGPYDQPSSSNRRGGSLLDRLSINPSPSDDHPGSSPALRDRVVPAKRDRDEMVRDGEDRMDGDVDMDDGFTSKRAKRRAGKARRGRGTRTLNVNYELLFLLCYGYGYLFSIATGIYVHA